MAADHATEAEEEYLQSLYWLFEAGLPMTGANLVPGDAALGARPSTRCSAGSSATATSSAATTARSASPTTAGDHAEQIVSRHRMIERFLTDVVGVPWDDVHEEAEHLEHAMTPRFEAYVRSAVGDAATCPHGHPIRVGERIDGVPLADCAVGAQVTILRLENEAEDLLHYLKAAGIEPGLSGEVAASDARRGDRRHRATGRPPSPRASPRRCR